MGQGGGGACVLCVLCEPVSILDPRHGVYGQGALFYHVITLWINSQSNEDLNCVLYAAWASFPLPTQQAMQSDMGRGQSRLTR